MAASGLALADPKVRAATRGMIAVVGENPSAGLSLAERIDSQMRKPRTVTRRGISETAEALSDHSKELHGLGFSGGGSTVAWLGGV